jgi:hypothetical protein
MRSRRCVEMGMSDCAASATEPDQRRLLGDKTRSLVWRLVDLGMLRGHAVEMGRSDYEPRTIKAEHAGDPFGWACAWARPSRLGMRRARCHQDQQPKKRRHCAAQRHKRYTAAKRAKPGTHHGQRAAVYRLLNVAEEAMGSKQSGEPIKRKNVSEKGS